MHHHTTRITTVVAKYTGHQTPLDSHRGGHDEPLTAQLTRILVESAQQLINTESELERCTAAIELDLAKIRSNLTAARAEPVYPLNPRGELHNQAVRVDTLIAVREAHIRAIQALTHLYQQGQRPPAPPQPDPPTT